AASVDIEPGSGQSMLSVQYPLRAGIHALSAFVGLFRDDRSLITYVATTPFQLGPWPGRAAFEDGMRARQAGDFAEAVKLLSTAIALSPDTSAYFYWRADCQLQLGHVDEALADYTHTLDLAPDDQASRIGRGIAWL